MLFENIIIGYLGHLFSIIWLVDPLRVVVRHQAEKQNRRIVFYFIFYLLTLATRSDN